MLQENSNTNGHGIFEDDAANNKLLDERLLEGLKFIQEHSRSLHSLLDPLKLTSSIITPNHRVVKTTFNSYEKVLVHDLISTLHNKNDLIHKVIIVLTYLADEINELKEIAESRLYQPLLMFGSKPMQPVPLHEVIEEDEEETLWLPGEREKLIGTFLPLLQEISNFIDRCYGVILNTVQQLSCLLNEKEQLYKFTFKGVHLFSLFSSLGDLLNVLITFDSIIQNNTVLQESWLAYKSMISSIRCDPGSFSTTITEIENFEKLLISLDQCVLNHQIYKSCIEQNFELSLHSQDEEVVDVRQNSTFLTELLYQLKYLVDNSITSASIASSNEINEKLNVVKSFALYGLYRNLVPSNTPPDTKLYKSLWSVQKLIPYVVIYSNIVWSVHEFLLPFSPYVDPYKKCDPSNPALHNRTFVQQFDSTLSIKCEVFSSQCIAWIALAESQLQTNTRVDAVNINQVAEMRGNVLLKGLSLAYKARLLVQHYLSFHSNMSLSFTRSHIHDLSLLIEAIQAMKAIFVRKESLWMESHIHLLRHIALNIQLITTTKRNKLENSMKKLDISNLDMTSILKIIDRLLESTETVSCIRKKMLQLISEILISSQLFQEKETMKLQTFFNRYYTFIDIYSHISGVCDLSFLYHYADILPSILSMIQSQPLHSRCIPYLIEAFNQGSDMCNNAYCEQSSSTISASTANNSFVVKYEGYIYQLIRKIITQPLCIQIETDLRLHVHSRDLDHMRTINPKADNLKLFRPFLDLPTFRVGSLVVDIKSEVTRYLDRTFYNLTTVALHDWKTYSNMRALALEKLGLQLTDTYLPLGSLDQGLDILQIMRNIHIFVSRFAYDMTMQQFIEYKPDKNSKHLNVIKIQSIAASIKQHGLGILNTTVNFTYQFLVQKFDIFSQFLFDDYIRSHLAREQRWFKKHRNTNEVNNTYPYERAIKFVKDIRKLGTTETGKSYLDQFRILITEIGNALGYVRMVRSASMYACSEAVKFVPDLDTIMSFEALASDDLIQLPTASKSGTKCASDVGRDDENTARGAGFSAETVRAATQLDGVVSTLIKNFGAGSDFFKVLVNVFQQVLLSPQHQHLQAFHMIVPSLCVSWIDASLQAKDAMHKATRSGLREIYFVDDGFPMGLAYCLAVLKLTRRGESLHWNDMLQAKYKADLSELQLKQAHRAEKEAALRLARENELKKKSFFSFRGSISTTSAAEGTVPDFEGDYEDYEEVNTLQVTAKRLEAQRRETEQLYVSLTSAGIFFKRTDVDI